MKSEMQWHVLELNFYLMCKLNKTKDTKIGKYVYIYIEKFI